MATRRPPPSRPRPLTEQQFTEMVARLSTYLPRRVSESVISEIDETLSVRETKISLRQIITSPYRALKKAVKNWISLNVWRQIPREIEAAFVWEPVLATSGLDPQTKTAILDWVRYPDEKWVKRAGGIIHRRVDVGFENLRQLREVGYIDAATWDLIQARAVRVRRLDTLNNLSGGRIWREYIQRPVLGKRRALISVARLQTARGAVRRGLRSVFTRLARTGVGRGIGTALRNLLLGGGAGTAVGGPAGAILGIGAFFFGGKFLSLLGRFARDITLASCGCLFMTTLGLVGLVVVVTSSAFHSSETGGGAAVPLVRVEKTANPHQIELVPADSQNPQVEFTIKVHNLSEQEISDGKIVDDFDEDNVTLYVLGGGDDSAPGEISWDVPPIPPGAVAEISYTAFVRANDGVDKVVTNRVNFTGGLGGRTISDSTLAFVVVGSPEGQYPSDWAVNEGCITQGPDGNDSHSGIEAVDIAPRDPQDKDSVRASAVVYATHDGTAFVGYRPATYGNYVEVISPLGFRTIYAHLKYIDSSVTNRAKVVSGQPLGVMGTTGYSSALHLHYELVGLEMDRPYIPLPADVDIRQCVGRDGCNNFCFGD